tara:strand:+ start:302 stop:778 length:477 start_codon:yes stop_codon:yes gene_type:complete
MEKKTRNILIASGIVLAGAVGAYFIFRKPKDTSGGENSGTGVNSGTDSGDGTGGTGAIDVGDGCEITNVIGKIAQVRSGSANTREGACTDTDLVVTAQGSGTTVGTVEKVKLGCSDASGSFNWYYVDLTDELEDASSMWSWAGEHTHAWVRCDVVRLV